MCKLVIYVSQVAGGNYFEINNWLNYFHARTFSYVLSMRYFHKLDVISDFAVRLVILDRAEIAKLGLGSDPLISLSKSRGLSTHQL